MNYKKFLLTLIILLTLSFVSADDTCYNNTVCFNDDSNVFQQNTGLFEGIQTQTVTTINPEESRLRDLIVKNILEDETVQINNLLDLSTQEFKDISDFYNYLQQQNAIGNVTLFTQKDLNFKTREYTQTLVNDNINWTFLLLIVIIEFFKIMLNVLLTLLMIFTFLRLIPLTLKSIKNFMFKIIMRNEK